MKITVEIEGTSYEVEIEDLNTDPVIAVVNGKRYPVRVQTGEKAAASTPAVVPSPRVLPQAAPAAPVGSGNANQLSAPLPGTIVSVEVKAGDSVKAGQVLCVLEAMKMKNNLQATRDAVIADVHVSQGDLVKHGQLLITFQS